MRVALSIMLMKECCNFICQLENEPRGGPIRIKHLLHSSAVRYGEIFHSPYLTLTRVVSHIFGYDQRKLPKSYPIDLWTIGQNPPLALEK